MPLFENQTPETIRSRILSKLETDLHTREAVYYAHMRMGASLTVRADLWLHPKPKKCAYGILLYDTVIRYAQGEPFVLYPPEKLRKWLLDVRNGKAELAEVQEIIKEKREAAESAAQFYDRERDGAFLDKWKTEMLERLKE